MRRNFQDVHTHRRRSLKLALGMMWAALLAMTAVRSPAPPRVMQVRACISEATNVECENLDIQRTWVARDMNRERRFLQSFLQFAMEQQERRKIALQSQLHTRKQAEDDEAKLHAKHLRRAAAVPQALEEVEAIERQLQALSDELLRGEDVDAIRNRIASEPFGSRLSTFVPPDEYGRPPGFGGLVFASPRGVPILVCAKRAEGDDVMRRVGQGADLWFQVRSGRGARVLLRTSMMRGMKGSRDCMICAAQLAAFYSDERSEDLVEVGYTDSRHVARANAARAGRMRDSKRLNAIAVRPADAAATVASHAAGLSLAEDLRSSGQEATTSPIEIAPAAAGPSQRRARKPSANTKERTVGAPPQRRRATRKQRLEQVEIDSLRERLAEASIDRRGGWRATKAKGNRRNRRYESRLLQNLEVGELWAHSEDD